MSGEAPPASAQRRPAPAAPAADALVAYIATLRNQVELTGLIMALEQGGARAAEDAGVQELVRQTGLDLGSDQDLRRAILALGAHAERLFGARAPDAPRLEERSLPELAEGLLRVFEATRQSVVDPSLLEQDLLQATSETLEIWQRNLPARSAEEARWWREARRTVEARAVSPYLRAARRLDRVEAEPLAGLLFRSPVAMAALSGLVGLLTFAMPVSTPLVCLGLALFGAFVVHPWYVRQVVEPLEALVQNLSAEAPRLERLAGEAPWTEDRFTIAGAAEDLLPILEGERRAGRASEDELRAAIAAYFDSVTPAWTEAGRGGRYLASLRRLVEGRLARDYARYARARGRWEGGFLAALVDHPGVMAIVLAVITLPVSFIVSRISPIPPSIDFPAMIGVFALLGYALPRLLPGTGPARAQLLDALAAEQSTVESVP